MIAFPKKKFPKVTAVHLTICWMLTKERKNDKLLLFRGRVKKKWSLTSIPTLYVHGAYRGKKFPLLLLSADLNVVDFTAEKITALKRIFTST